MKTQPSTPTSKLSVGLQDINHTNKLSELHVLPQITLIPQTSSGFFFHGSTAVVGLGLIFEASWSHSGVDYTGLHTICQLVHYQLWNLLATKSEQMKMKFFSTFLTTHWLVYYPTSKLTQCNWYVPCDETLKFFSSSLRCQMIN